ncbi:hypothetical protein BGW37DRAFT_504799 [Umbelopsis sp. PMI_123]|nr:hypothetical protein BGW37DRAFT_504799 [Umbelopsis sp. PMI_123]
MSQYLHPPAPSNQHHHASSPLVTSVLSSTPNLSPWSMSQTSDQSSRTSYSHYSSPHRQDSLSEGDCCPTPVLSPSLWPKDDPKDETQVPRGYDIGPHEPIHMPVNLSLYPPGIPGLPPAINTGSTFSGYFQPSKRQERIARFRARLQSLQHHHFQQRGMEFAPPPQQQWPLPPTPRFLWCYRIYDVGKNREPWRAFIPENQMLLWQFPEHDIHIRDPSIEGGRKVITVAANRSIAYHNDPDMRAPQTFEIQLLDIAQRPVVLEPLPKVKR